MDNSTGPDDTPLPPLFTSTAESVLQDANATIATTRSLWNRIVGEVSPETATIENTIIPVARNENQAKLVTDIVYLYATTHPSQEIRESSKEATRLVADAEVDLYLRDDMFQLVNAVVNKTEESSTDPETYRFLLKHRAQFLKNGCDLHGEARSQFEADLKRLGKAVQMYKSNLDNDNSGMWFSVEELDGLPPNFVDSLKQGEAESENEGKRWVNTKRGHSTRLLKYAKSEDVRRRYYIGLYNRMPENIVLAREIILLRDSLARKKDEKSWAHYKMSEKMITKPEMAISMLEDLRSKLAKIGKRDAEELLNLKKADIHGEEAHEIKLFLWDISYYENVKQEKAASVNNGLIMEYFELKTVLRSILDLYGQLFDIEFERVTPGKAEELHGEKSSYSTWHENVFQFLVWDTAAKSDQKQSSFLGHVFFDLYSRQGKYTHAGQLTFQKAFEKVDGSRTYPSSAIVMNYAKPPDAKPLLMSVQEVRSLFHEIGHSMHNMLSITKFARFHGSRVDRDFVETPSILFEQFLWEPKHIREVSRHYSHISPAFKAMWQSENPEVEDQPLEELPDDFVKVVLKTTESSLGKLRQLHFATYDMLVYNPPSREALEQMNLCEVFNKTWVKLVPAHGGEALGLGWEWAHGESCVRLMMGDNYDAGYYAYILGAMWARDIFETFFKKDTTNKVAARRLRNWLLKPGASQNEWKTLTEYLGREPRPDALLRWYGVTESP